MSVFDGVSSSLPTATISARGAAGQAPVPAAVLDYRIHCGTAQISACMMASPHRPAMKSSPITP